MYSPRTVFAKIWEKIDSHEIILLNGARQIGKTTLLKMIKEKLLAEKNITEKQIFWYDLENSDDLTTWSEQKNILPKLPLTDKSSRYFIFIDEFQKSKTIGSTLKVIHDHYPQFKIIITGSASWFLDIDESLAGRKRVIPIWPLSFFEYITWREETNFIANFQSALSDISSCPTETINSINQRLIQFFAYGGYPSVVLESADSERIELLGEIIDAYLIRDLQLTNATISPTEAKKILTLLASQTSSSLSISNLCANSGIGRTAILSRMHLLQDTFILKLVRPFFTNKIKELTKNPKVFLVDTGLRNFLLGNFALLSGTNDFGLVAENFVMMEFFKHKSLLDQLFYWRTPQNQEVDIVVKKEQKLIPIEVKSGNESSIPTGLKAFISRYNPTEAYVLNWSIVKEEKYRDTKILFRPLWYRI